MNLMALPPSAPVEEEDIVGTEHYISPEMIGTKQCSYSGDLWTFGFILY